jgi:hypothetical protein
MPVIPDAQEAEIRGWRFEGSLGKVTETLSKNKPT